MFWFMLIPWVLRRSRDRGDGASQAVAVIGGLLAILACAVVTSPWLVWRTADQVSVGDPAVKVIAGVTHVTASVIVWMIFGGFILALCALAVSIGCGVYLEHERS